MPLGLPLPHTHTQTPLPPSLSLSLSMAPSVFISALLYLLNRRHLLVVLLLLIAGISCRVRAECAKSHTIRGENKAFANCNELGTQGASIAWSLEAENGTLQVLFSGNATAPGGWVGWGINPSGLSMEGTQAFIAFEAPNGSTLLTYNVTSNTKLGSPFACSPISLRVLDTAVEIVGLSVSIFVSISLPSDQTNSSTSLLNHVWNRGPSVSNFQPALHGLAAEDLSGLKTINMSSGIVAAAVKKPRGYILKNRHAILNIVGWGILLPGGVIAARYLKPVADPFWFYVHVMMQIVGYGLGVGGFMTGLRLGSDSVGVIYEKHRFVGIALFSTSTLQVLAILIRPKKDHKIRKYWNMYHYSLGVTILALGIINIFFGFDIFSPQAKWRHMYIGLLIGLGSLAFILEVVTWIHTLSKRHYAQGKMQGMTVGGAYHFEKGPLG